MAILQIVPQPSITKISLKITYLKFHLNLPGANDLNEWIHFADHRFWPDHFWEGIFQVQHRVAPSGGDLEAGRLHHRTYAAHQTNEKWVTNDPKVSLIFYHSSTFNSFSAAEIWSPGRQMRPMNPPGDPRSHHRWSVWRPMNSLFRFCRKYFRMKLDIRFTDTMCLFVLVPK